MKISKKKVNEVLERSAELVAKGWCQGSYAKDKNGERCHFTDRRAKSFCLSGAINKITNELVGNDDYKLAYRVTLTLGENLSAEAEAPSSWNDSPDRTQQEVVDMLLHTRYANGR